MGTNNGDIILIIVSSTIVLLILLVFIIIFLFIYKKRQAMSRLEIKGITERYNHEILRTQLEIQEQTLKNISQEIHDNMGQVLSLVVLNLSSVECGDPIVAGAKIESSTNLVKKVIRDLRNLSRTLDADNMAKVGLPAIIRHELEMLDKTGAYRTSYTQTGPERRLDASREIVAYRIVQESLNNIIKHALATAVEIGLAFSDQQLVIEVADNGRGFDLADAGSATLQANGSGMPPSNGAGIKNMKSRAQLINAELAISSVPSTGTRIRLTLPLAT